MSARIPAEVYPVGVFIAEELEARGWTTAELARRMMSTKSVSGTIKAPRTIAMNQRIIEMLIAVSDPNCRLDAVTVAGLSRAFGVSQAIFRNLEMVYLAAMTGRK